MLVKHSPVWLMISNRVLQWLNIEHRLYLELTNLKTLNSHTEAPNDHFTKVIIEIRLTFFVLILILKTLLGHCFAHAMTAQLSCAKLWPGLIIVFHITATCILKRFRLQAEKKFMNLKPVPAMVCIVPRSDILLFHVHANPTLTCHQLINYLSSKTHKHGKLITLNHDEFAMK